MQNRREFLRHTVAAGIALAAPSIVQAQCQSTINQKLRAISARLLESGVVQRTELCEVPYPTSGLVQWQWAHFHPFMEEDHIPKTELVQRQLLRAMKHLHEGPGTAIEELHHEGIVAGREEATFAEYRRVHRDLVEGQLSTSIPMFLSPQRQRRRNTENVEQEVRSMSRFAEPVTQIVYAPRQRRGRVMSVSPLVRLGAGYAFSQQEHVPLRATEDEVIDARAERAEYFGSDDDFKKYVIDERNTHFVKNAAAVRGKIMHLLLGFEHHLTKDIVQSNGGVCTGISHLLVRVKGIEAIKPTREQAGRATLWS